MRLVGIVVVVLGAFTALSYPISLWWEGQVLAHELRELDGFDLIRHDERTLTLVLPESTPGMVVLADLTLQQEGRLLMSPSEAFRRELREIGKDVNEQLPRTDGLDAEVIQITGEDAENRTVDIRLELHDSDVIGFIPFAFFFTVGVAVMLFGRFLIVIANARAGDVEVAV